MKVRKYNIIKRITLCICLGIAGWNITQAASPRSALPSEHITRAISPDIISQLPPKVIPVLSEQTPNKAIAKAIIHHYNIPETAWEKTRYYYNYVDLNGDGMKEIFVVITGPYTSGSGGDSALWLIPNANMAVGQSFTLIHTPIIITKKSTNGHFFGPRGIIVHAYGGGSKSKYVQLISHDGEYDTVNAASAVADYNSIEGTAIICDDIAKDIQEQRGLTLADSQ